MIAFTFVTVKMIFFKMNGHIEITCRLRKASIPIKKNYKPDKDKILKE